MDPVELLEKLVSIDTSVPPGNNYEKLMLYLAPLFENASCRQQIVEIPPEHAENREGRLGLIAHRRQPGKPRLIFYGHIDVVPAHGWNAFEPRLTNGKLYGRGSADMKGAIVSLLVALDSIKDKSMNYDLSIILTTDEELSQVSQLRYLRPFIEPVLGAGFFSLDANFGSVAIANLGTLQFDVVVKGKSVHSGLSHLGVNAVEKAQPLVQALLDLKSEVIKRKSKIPTHPDTGLTQMEARLNINMLRGGLKVNIVPDQCIISVDRRLIPEENIEDAEKEIMQTLSSVKDVEWDIIPVLRIPTIPATQAPIVDRLAEVIQRVTGKTGKYGEMGSGDLGILVNNEWQGKVFGSGVIRTECNIHGNDEFVFLKDVEDLASVIQLFLISPDSSQ